MNAATRVSPDAKPRLLVVEDDLGYAGALCRRMSRHGFDCRHLSEPTEALLCARQWQPTHVLLDMKLTNHSGLKLIPPLRASLPSSMLVLLTGYASIATAVEAVKLGADNYLAKPVDSHTLLSTLLPSTKLRIPVNPASATITSAASAGPLQSQPQSLLVPELQMDADGHASPLMMGMDSPMNPRRLEWEHIQQALAVNEGNVSATARQLGMHRRTLQRKLAKKP